MTNAPQGSQINALTATRAVAALLVFIHHFGTDVFPFSLAPYFFGSGNIAVGYFFVLSGFVLYISYTGKDFSYGNYLSKRIGRIVPIYEIALLLAVYDGVAFFNYNLHSAQSVKEILYSAFFVHAFIPSYPLVLNGPGWTISIEMFFYVLFPLLLVLQNKNIRIFIVLTILLFIASQYFHLKYYPQRRALDDNIVDTVFFNPVIHLSQFLLGMIGGYIYNARKNFARLPGWLPSVLFVVIVLLIAYRPENISYHTGLIAPLFMLLIIGIAINQPRMLGVKPFVYLGEISYGIYILQQPVYKYFDAINKAHWHMPKQYFFWLALALLLLIASATYYTIEMPLRKKIGSMRWGIK